MLNRVWAMIDSGSAPDVANCEKAFPHHPIRESKAQRQGINYVNASGGLIPNKGETAVVHRDSNGTDFQFVFQHADVHCPILSVRRFVKKGCRVTFRKGGGVIRYPDGRKLFFQEQKRVFFAPLDIVPPEDVADTVVIAPLGFARQEP